MSALLHCLLPPKVKPAEPTRVVNLCLDDVEVRKPRPRVLPRADSKKLTYNGEELTVREWAGRVGLTRQALYKRIADGWTIERALTAPIGARR